ncbi:MAG: VCBS repeat-containing protein [Cyclobacteriaceae bacterium]
MVTQTTITLLYQWYKARYFINAVLAFFWSAVALSGCQQSDTTPLFNDLEADYTGVDFRNDLVVIDSINILNYIYAFNGGGVGVGDLNNDGLEDLIFSGNRVPSRIYLNLGNFKFKDITSESGINTNRWCTGVSLVDINADGFLDIYFSVAGTPNPALRRNLLYINNGQGQFEEAADKWGLADSSYSTNAAFFDYDKDGDLDLYLLNHANDRAVLNTPLPKKTAGESPSTDRLYRNNGDETFTDVSTEAGITIEGYGLGVAISDIDDDGWPDIYISNDFISNDLLYLNNTDGTFSNVITDAIREQSYNGMGNDVADFNNDGLMDIIVMDMLASNPVGEKMMAGSMNHDKFMRIKAMGYEAQFVRNTLQLNQGNMTFAEVGRFAGVHRTDWSWAPLFADLDNDGWKDLYVTNGYLRDITNKDFIDYNNNLSMFKSVEQANEEGLERIAILGDQAAVNYAFRNDGNLKFEQSTSEWFGQKKGFSNGAAYSDLDNDGDLDLVINNINGSASVLRNESTSDANYLQIQLVGPELNLSAVGAKVHLTTSSGQQYLEQSPSRGFMSNVSSILHFGLGEDTLAMRLKVVWPDGKVSRAGRIAPNQRLRVDYADASLADERPGAEQFGELFIERTHELGLKPGHVDGDYPDFKQQPLFPYRTSSEGFEVASGDFDGDGLDDLFASSGISEHTIFFQEPDGSFSATVQDNKSVLLKDVVVADINGDEIDDLLLLGNDKEENGNSVLSLYFGDRDRSFTDETAMLPISEGAISAIALGDYDGDDDLDLLWSEDGGAPYQSRLKVLQNEGETFMDVSANLLPDMELIGIVKDLMMTDYNGDGQLDIIIVGEWMSVVFLLKEDERFVRDMPVPEWSHSNGWWRNVTAADMDQDGDMDLILGNMGQNTGYELTAEYPATLHLLDINGDKKPAPLMTYYVAGEETLQPTREALLHRYPFLNRLFPNHLSYAEADIQNLIQANSPLNSFSANTTTSYYLENDAGGFIPHHLPKDAQLFPVGESLAHDFDRDGYPELILAGGFSLAEEDGRSYGRSNPVLVSREDGELTSSARSPFHASGDITSMTLLRYKNDQWLIAVAIRNDGLKIFQYCPDKKCELE